MAMKEAYAELPRLKEITGVTTRYKGPRAVRDIARQLGGPCLSTHLALKWLRARYNLAPLENIVASNDFLDSYEWKRLRVQAFAKYGNRCQCCGATAANAQLQVDHIKPRLTHPELALDINNLQVLCHPCNQGKANRQFDFRGCQPEEPTR